MWTIDDQRELAAKLKSSGLTAKAVQEYEQYARVAPLDRKTYATLCYTIGKMCMEAGDYEKALVWLYRVEIADPHCKSKTDANSSIVTCLERLGKHSAAEHALSRQTSLAERQDKPTSPIIAEIGNERIYLEDINEALDRLPPWMRKQFEGAQGRREFAKKYVADELLYRKALKLGYDKDPAILKRKKDIEKELLVATVIEHEVKNNITIDEHDVKTYFEAHRSDYEEKEAVKVCLIKSASQEAAKGILQKLKAGKDFRQLEQELTRDKSAASPSLQWVRKGENDLGIGRVEEISALLFGKKPGEIVGPVEAEGGWYIFRIEEIKPGRVPSYSEVKERVKQDYFFQKFQAHYQTLLEQTVKSCDVKLNLEAFNDTTRK